MRVTKRIEEYIRSEVEKKYKNSSIEIEREKNKKQIEEKWKEIDNYAREKMRPFYGDNVDRNINYHPSFGTTLFEKEHPSLYNKVEKKVNDILISLELGATKEELDRLLNFDVDE